MPQTYRRPISFELLTAEEESLACQLENQLEKIRLEPSNTLPVCIVTMILVGVTSLLLARLGWKFGWLFEHGAVPLLLTLYVPAMIVAFASWPLVFRGRHQCHIRQFEILSSNPLVPRLIEKLERMDKAIRYVNSVKRHNRLLPVELQGNKHARPVLDKLSASSV